jgi:DNA invertase Pin-like site-specific DNA recombinase
MKNNNKLTNKTDALIASDNLRRQAIVYCRQSTKRQARADYQRSLVAVARSYAWPDSQIEIIEDLRRSGSSSERRPGWNRLQDMIDADQVGAVFVTTISRLSRQAYDLEVFRLRAALHNTLLFADGRFLDPTESNDTTLSQITAVVATCVAAREKNRPGNDSPTSPAGDSTGSTTTSSDCGKSSDREKNG